jgi:hypothetical protein
MVVPRMVISVDNDDGDRKENPEHLPITPEIIAKINNPNQQPSVLKANHVSMLKNLAKSVMDIDLLVQIRNGRVYRIRPTLDDFFDPGIDASVMEE